MRFRVPLYFDAASPDEARFKLGNIENKFAFIKDFPSTDFVLDKEELEMAETVWKKINDDDFDF